MAGKNKLGWRDLGDGERDELLARRLRGAATETLIDEFNLSVQPHSLERRLREWRMVRLKPRVRIETGNFEAHWELFCQLIGRDPKRRSTPAKKKPAGKRRKVVVLCDLHGQPDKEIIAKVVNESADLYILAGDVFDAFAFSRFEKDKTVPIADELASVRATVELLAHTGAEVWLIEGNHDARGKKYFAQHISPEFMPLVRWNLLELAVIDVPGAKLVKNTYDFHSPRGRKLSQALQNVTIAHVGDAMIAHAEVARKGEARTADALVEWINAWRRPLGWDEPVLVIQAHVHRASMTWPHGGHQVRMEGGYCGEVSSLQYAMDYGRTGYTPPVLGYTRFEQECRQSKWFTDLSSVQFITC